MFKSGRWKKNFRLPKYNVINIFKLKYLCYSLSDWYQLSLVKAEWRWLYFVNELSFVTSGLAYMTSLNFQVRIFLLLFVELSHNLVRKIWVVHVSLRSYKISCDLEGHLDLWGQGQGQRIFLYCLICRFIPPQILDWVNSNFQLWLLKKRTFGWRGFTSSIYLNWNIFFICCWFDIKLILVKKKMTMTFSS